MVQLMVAVTLLLEQTLVLALGLVQQWHPMAVPLQIFGKRQKRYRRRFGQTWTKISREQKALSRGANSCGMLIWEEV